MNRSERRREPGRKSTPNSRRTTIVYGSLAVLAIIVIGAIAIASRTPNNAASDAPIYAALPVGQAAPAFSAATTQGPVNVPVADHKPVLLEVFATWCPHCQHEVSVLNPLFHKYGDKVHFVAVSGSPYAGDEHSPSSQLDVINFAQKFKVAYPIAYDPDMTVAHKYLQGGYPTIVVIDRAGKIAAVRDGEIPQSAIQSDLEKALKS
jgi:thiol-disulfide isomerase/thioredoxin